MLRMLPIPITGHIGYKPVFLESLKQVVLENNNGHLTSLMAEGLLSFQPEVRVSCPRIGPGEPEAADPGAWWSADIACSLDCSRRERYDGLAMSCMAPLTAATRLPSATTRYTASMWGYITVSASINGTNPRTRRYAASVPWPRRA